jgi:hypothetical protein
VCTDDFGVGVAEVVGQLSGGVAFPLFCVGEATGPVDDNFEWCFDGDGRRESGVKTPADPVAESNPDNKKVSMTMAECTGLFEAICMIKTTEVEVAVVVDVITLVEVGMCRETEGLNVRTSVIVIGAFGILDMEDMM